MEAVKHGYEDNRRLLVEGLPRAGFDSFLPVDGAFYLYADVSRFCNDSFAFAGRMLEEAGVAATPGTDFDPVHGRRFIRFSYAGSTEDMREGGRADRGVAQAGVGRRGRSPDERSETGGGALVDAVARLPVIPQSLRSCGLRSCRQSTGHLQMTEEP